jgi:hypothetical protein
MKHVALISKNADCPAKADSLLAKAALIQNIQEALVAAGMALDLTNKE